MLLVDAHQDLAWNILTFGRDYTQSAADTRLRERGTQIPIHNGDTLLGWPDYQQGQVAIIFATLFATPIRSQLGDWDTQSYADADQAYSHYNTQLDAYYRLTDEHSGKFRLISYLEDLKAVLSHWEQETAETHPVGLVPLMEGAEAVRHPSELEEWWQRGVRIIGPAWIGTCYCGGTHEPGPLTHEGYALLDGMAGLGFSLDISHMDEKAVFQALDEYPGRIIASHANARALLKGNESNRFLSNRVIRASSNGTGSLALSLSTLSSSVVGNPVMGGRKPVSTMSSTRLTISARLLEMRYTQGSAAISMVGLGSKKHPTRSIRSLT